MPQYKSHEKSLIKDDEEIKTFAAREIFGLQDSQMTDLAASGVVKKAGYGKVWLKWTTQSLLQYYRDRSTSTQKSMSRGDVQNELDRQKTRNMELKNLVLEKKYADVQIMKNIIASAFTKCRVVLESIEPEIRQKWGDKVPQSVLKLISDKVNMSQNEIAEDTIDPQFEDLIEVESEK